MGCPRVLFWGPYYLSAILLTWQEKSCPINSFYIYVDDTALLVHGTDAQEIEFKLEHELKNISNMVKIDKLSLNSRKTKVMLFCSNGLKF